MDSSAVKLPAIGDLSPSVVSFLNSTFHARPNLDFPASTRLALDLQSHCDQLSKFLADLGVHLQSSLNSYDSYSRQADVTISHIKADLDDLESKSSCSFIPGGEREREGLQRAEMVGMAELPALAKEVARIEAVRIYAETTLKLDNLVGDVEDAVSFIMNKNLQKHSIARNSEEGRLGAINSIRKIENILTSIAGAHPQWTRLISAVDHRVDRALATLRLQAIADYRALLTSFGWPPPLSNLNSSNLDGRRSPDVSNPLFTIHGALKQKYCETFLNLCSLQELQQRRKSRQLEGYKQNVALHQPLWAIEELVNPLFVASQQHFAKWVDKPEFIFALSYKVVKDYVDSMDELLQPLVDEAMLTGYSCKEEWISAIVASLSTYLAKELFPAYISRIEAETASDGSTQTKMAWLHLVDLMIEFDKRIWPMAVHVGDLGSLLEDENLLRISSFTVFSDRPDWFDVWLEIELGDIMDKLRLAMEDERNWTTKIHGSAFEDYKSPKISLIFLQQVSSIIDRCRSMPTVAMRLRFVQLVIAPVINRFLDFLVTKCLEAQGLTALADDEALIKVMNAINSAHQLGSVLKEWSEDVLFIEMATKKGGELDLPTEELRHRGGSKETLEFGILDPEIKKLEEFRKEWVEMITTVVLRGFDAHSRDYVRNKKQWQERVEDGGAVTSTFITALDYLQQKMLVLEQGLNGVDFSGIWRGLATGVDRMIFSGILMSNVKFSESGVERFRKDIEVLCGTFRTWCLRPEGFLPCLYEGLKLLRMDEKHLQELSVRGESWMDDNRIRHLTVDEARRIARGRVSAV